MYRLTSLTTRNIKGIYTAIVHMYKIDMIIAIIIFNVNGQIIQFF
jgi:hypothetical protein